MPLLPQDYRVERGDTDGVQEDGQGSEPHRAIVRRAAAHDPGVFDHEPDDVGLRAREGRVVAVVLSLRLELVRVGARVRVKVGTLGLGLGARVPGSVQDLVSG